MQDSIERLGEVLVRLGALSKEQVDDILKYQKDHPGMLFGRIAIQLGYITEEKLDKFL